MVTCPNGHQSRATDYCDICGAPIGAAPTPPQPTGPKLVKACPNCGADSPADALFCESCGYDFTTGTAPAAPQANDHRRLITDPKPVVLPTPEPDAAPVEPVIPAPAESSVPEPAAPAPLTPPAPTTSSAPASVDPAVSEPTASASENSDEPSPLIPPQPVDVRADLPAAGEEPAVTLDPPAPLTPPDQASPDPVSPLAPPEGLTPPAPQETTAPDSSSDPAPAPQPAPTRSGAPVAQPAVTTSRLPLDPAWGRWVVEVWVDPEWYSSQDVADDLPSPAPPRIIEVKYRTNLIGRPSVQRGIRPDIDCDPDGGVSRRQAELTTDGVRWWVRDLDSANGTYLGRVDERLPAMPIAGRVEIGPDERIYLGAWTRLVVRPAIEGELDAPSRG